MLSKDTTFTQYAKSKLALMRALAESANPVHVDKREVAKYNRLQVLDETGGKKLINVTPKHVLEIHYKYDAANLSREPILELVHVKRDGQLVDVIPSAQIPNISRFKNWVLQNTYCFLE